MSPFLPVAHGLLTCKTEGFCCSDCSARTAETDATTCASSDVGHGWVLVRRTESGSFPVSDNLAGTAVIYNAHQNAYHDPLGPTFSQKFDGADFDEFLFATGDCTKWMIMQKEQAIGQFYTDQQPRQIVKSHTSNTPYMAEMYFRQGFSEDPLLSFGDHTRDWATVLYAERLGSAPAQLDGLSGHIIPTRE